MMIHRVFINRLIAARHTNSGLQMIRKYHKGIETEPPKFFYMRFFGFLVFALPVLGFLNYVDYEQKQHEKRENERRIAACEEAIAKLELREK